MSTTQIPDVEIDTKHHLVGKRVQINPIDSVVEGLHNKTGIIESVKTIRYSHVKEVLFVIKLDEPYISAPGWRMDYLQDSGTSFRFLNDEDNSQYLGNQ